MRDGTNKELIFNLLNKVCYEQGKEGIKVGCTTDFLTESLRMQRANVSSILNELYREGKIGKIKGKPVLYFVNSKVKEDRKVIETSNFDMLIGNDKSLKSCVQKAKAAILYPPRGLHSLLLGPTGVGKTMFAELIYKFAVENGVFDLGAPFISFNCADYSNNPQLLFSFLFGSKKGAYTGAYEDRIGLVEQANNGILFLDEVHRLPPEGQEMLFNLIDKGIFQPLGGVEEIKEANVLIICATTENEDSVLLSTFKRRIPMMITMPALKERTFEERFQLTCEFFKLEARRTGKEIKLTSDAMKNLLLYNCTGNVGQLKSDIQLACANAFLKCITGGGKIIQVDLNDLPDYVRRGIINYKLYKDEVDRLVTENTKFSFTSKSIEKYIETGENLITNNFYENIEKRILELKKRNIDEKDINMIMSLDIDNYFKKYIYKLSKNVNKNELSKIIDERIISIIEAFLDFAGNKLNRLFPQKIFYGLCFHFNATLERLKNGKSIVNHKLNEIIEKYPDEYAISMHFSVIAEKEFGVKIPIDEIGFVTMFICEDFIYEHNQFSKPVVLIAMHGTSTASSMAEVVNKLIGGNNTYAYDMPLDKPTKEAYEEIKSLICQIDRGGGVIMLVDMGSLGMYGEVISEETGIQIRVIDMATTVLALECSRKALVENDIDSIWNEVKIGSESFINYSSNAFKSFEPNKDNIIITMCITGEGSAVKIKNMIEENVMLDEKNVQVIPMSISSKKDMQTKLKKLSGSKNILCIVGAINPELHGIPYISVSELIMDKNYKKIKQLINYAEEKSLENKLYNQKQLYNEVIDSLKNEVKSFDIEIFRPLILKFIDELNDIFNSCLTFDVSIGLIFHMCSSIERIMSNQKIPEFKYKDEILKNYPNEIKIIDKCLEPIKNAFNIISTDDELCAIFYFFEYNRSIE